MVISPKYVYCDYHSRVCFLIGILLSLINFKIQINEIYVKFKSFYLSDTKKNIKNP